MVNSDADVYYKRKCDLRTGVSGLFWQFGHSCSSTCGNYKSYSLCTHLVCWRDFKHIIFSPGKTLSCTQLFI